MPEEGIDSSRAEFVAESRKIVAQCYRDLLAIVQGSLSHPPSPVALWLDPELIYSLYRQGVDLLGLASLSNVKQMQDLLASLAEVVEPLRMCKIPLTRDLLRLGSESILHLNHIIDRVAARGFDAASGPSLLIEDVCARLSQAAITGILPSQLPSEPMHRQTQPPLHRVNPEGAASKVPKFIETRVHPLKMVELEGGSFWMGSRETDRARYDDEGLPRQIVVSPFAMGAVPVTQQLYQEVMELEASPGFFQGKRRPIEQVSFFDAVQFCNKLSQRMGLVPCYGIEEECVKWERQANGYRLPSEAEWEYACRAGTETAYSFSDDTAQLGEYAWYKNNSEGRTHEVGRKQPNQWGLFDLHGNVWEWCWDSYDTNNVTADNDSLKPPVSAEMGCKRVVRGGAFVFGARFLRAAARFGVRPANRSRIIGFRFVRSLHGKSRHLVCLTKP